MSQVPSLTCGTSRLWQSNAVRQPASQIARTDGRHAVRERGVPARFPLTHLLTPRTAGPLVLLTCCPRTAHKLLNFIGGFVV